MAREERPDEVGPQRARGIAHDRGASSKRATSLHVSPRPAPTRAAVALAKQRANRRRAASDVPSAERLGSDGARTRSFLHRKWLPPRARQPTHTLPPSAPSPSDRTYVRTEPPCPLYSLPRRSTQVRSHLWRSLPPRTREARNAGGAQAELPALQGAPQARRDGHMAPLRCKSGRQQPSLRFLPFRGFRPLLAISVFSRSPSGRTRDRMKPTGHPVSFAAPPAWNASDRWSWGHLRPRGRGQSRPRQRSQPTCTRGEAWVAVCKPQRTTRPARAAQPSQQHQQHSQQTEADQTRDPSVMISSFSPLVSPQSLPEDPSRGPTPCAMGPTLRPLPCALPRHATAHSRERSVRIQLLL
jgi:hypothetical protein